jgi:hypothetical protein
MDEREARTRDASSQRCEGEREEDKPRESESECSLQLNADDDRAGSDRTWVWFPSLFTSSKSLAFFPGIASTYTQERAAINASARQPAPSFMLQASITRTTRLPSLLSASTPLSSWSCHSHPRTSTFRWSQPFLLLGAWARGNDSIAQAGLAPSRTHRRSTSDRRKRRNLPSHACVLITRGTD